MGKLGHSSRALALAASLALLLVHAWSYRFLTDDAFISFRYAHNLSHGAGLVFNPGERVEGYSDFLWVVLLAAADRVGIRPEAAAIPLSLLATVALWATTVWLARRVLPAGATRWWVLLPVTLLAATRSVAVWSTSGLETRMFEALALAGVARWMLELERIGSGDRPGTPLAALLLGLACLTRPDGLLVAFAVVVAGAAWLAARKRLDPRAFLGRTWLLAALVGSHELFRLAYYHQWLPNTYFAKVGGRTWWGWGATYLQAFALEYAAYFWVPLLVVAVVALARPGMGLVPLLAAAVVIPHVIYVAAIGGDHFEYRPLDLYFPLVFVMLMVGARALARGRAARVAVAAYVVLVLAGLWALPWQTRREFPSRYASGFPGAVAEDRAARAFVRPERNALYAWWPARAVAESYRRLLFRLTAHFVALRAEEHRLFLGVALDEAVRVRRCIDAGLVPRDAYVAISSVGAIPYVTGLRTLDRLGLTDAHIAHTPFAHEGYLAHGKHATLEYARERGVDLWSAHEVLLVLPVTAMPLRAAIRQGLAQGSAAYAAYVGENDYLVAELPQGLARTRQRMPRLEFQPLGDSGLAAEYAGRAIAAWRDSLRRDPANDGAARALAYMLIAVGRYGDALDLLRPLAARASDEEDVWENMAVALEHQGDRAGAAQAMDHALAIAVANNNAAQVEYLRVELIRLQKTGP